MRVRAGRRTVHASERGSALAASLVVVMIIASLGAGLIQMHGAMARRQMQSVDNKRALYMAEAGLSEAFMAVTHGKSGKIGSPEIPAAFGNGLFWVEATEQPDNSVALVSHGLCETGRFSLAMVVRRQISPVASRGLFGADSITIGEGSIIDGYDSTAGSFVSQVDVSLPHASTGQGALITSNSDIQIDGATGGGKSGDGTRELSGGAGETSGLDATWVYGDARPGPLGTVLSDPDVLVTGSTMPALKPQKVEPMEPPTGLGTLESMNVASVRPTVLSSAQVQLRKLNVASGSELVLEGPTTVLAMGLTLEPNATLTIDTTNGPVMMYVTTYVDMAAGSVLANHTADPTQVALVLGSEGELDYDGDGVLEPSVSIASQGEFDGLLYAPRSDLAIPSDLRMFGVLNARSVDLAPGSHFSYDAAMTHTGVAVTGLPGLLSWRIVELPDEPLVKRRIDPVRWLELQGITPTKSSEAFDEDCLHLDYLDAAGVPQTYQGDEASFDWNQVKTVTEMRWAKTVPDLATAPKSSGAGESMGALKLLTP